MGSAPTRRTARRWRGSTPPRAGRAFNPLIAHVASLEAARKLARFDARRRNARRRVLAGPADAGAAEAARLRRRRSRARRPRQRGGARAGASAGAGAARRIRRADRGAVGQPLRPCLADDARPMCWPICAGASTWCSTAGPAPVGVESTIVACLEQPALLRPGGVPRDAIERVLGHPLTLQAIADEAPLAPGMLSVALRAESAAAARRRAPARGRSLARLRARTRRPRMA